MTSSVVGALRVTLGLDSAQFEKGAKGSQRALNRLRGQFVAFSAVAASAAVALGGLTIATARTATEISRLAQVSNTAPEALQRWSAGAKTVGIEQEKLSDILKDVNDRVGDFITTGGGPMADFFENIAPKVGITADAFRNLSGADALQLFVSSLEKANLSQAEMTFYMEAMASDSTLLLPLLRNNADEMNRLGENSRSLGAIMSNETVAALNNANLAVGNVSLAFQGMRNRIAGELAPALEVLANGFANSMREGEFLREATDTIIQNLDVLATATAAVAAVMGVRYVAALALARGATVSFAGAVTVARAALALLTGPLGLIYTGIGLAAGAFIVFRKNADVATTAVDEGRAAIGLLNEALSTFSTSASPAAQSAALTNASAYKKQAEAALAVAEAELVKLEAIQKSGNALLDQNPLTAGGNSGYAEAMAQNAAVAKAEVESLRSSLDLANNRIKNVVTSITTVAAPIAETVTPAVKELDDAVVEMGRGGAGAARGLENALADVSVAAGQAEQAHEQWASNAAGHFDGLITGGKSLSDVLKSIARQLESTAWQQLFNGMGGGGGGGGNFLSKAFSFLTGGGGGGGGITVPQNVLASLVPKFATGTSYAPGGMSWVGEQGPELVNLPRGSQVFTAGQSRQMMQGGGGRTIIELRMSPEVEARVLERSANQSVEITRQGLQQFSGETLTQLMRQGSADPRAVRT